jgi:hypothetical protein
MKSYILKFLSISKLVVCSVASVSSAENKIDCKKTPSHRLRDGWAKPCYVISAFEHIGDGETGLINLEHFSRNIPTLPYLKRPKI